MQLDQGFVVLEGEHFRHAAVLVLPEIGPTPSDGGGRSRYGEPVHVKEGQVSRSLRVVGS